MTTGTRAPGEASGERGGAVALLAVVLLLLGGAAIGAWAWVQTRKSPEVLESSFTPFPPVFDDDADRVAIFGDIHGNLQALQAVLADVRQRGVLQCICTGDIVGYGANPDECCDLIASMGCPVVVGNHDKYCSSSDELARFNPEAAKSVFWTRGRLTPERKSWLRELPYVVTHGDFTVVHSNLFSPEKWEYVLKKDDAEVAFQAQESTVCFIGHSHVPVAFARSDGAVRVLDPYTVALEEGTSYIVNVGSVGQPRDGDAKACYAIYDRTNRTVTLQRVAYDMGVAQTRIVNEGLPRKNADRLTAAR